MKTNSQSLLKIYFITSRPQVIDKIRYKSLESSFSVIDNDPIYIINLDSLPDECNFDRLDKREIIPHYFLIKNDWIPEKIYFNNLSIKLEEFQVLQEELKNYYSVININSQQCLIRKNALDEENYFSAQKIFETRCKTINLQRNYLEYLSNCAGMFFLSEPKSDIEFEIALSRIQDHFNKISFLSNEQSLSGLLYKSAFNKLDYGVSIVSNDRLIIYTNNIRRKLFGNDIIGKKCFEVFVLDPKDNPCSGCPMGEKHSNIYNDTCKSNRSEIHKLRDKNGRVYFISETSSALEIANLYECKLEVFGINVVRNNSAKTITNEFQKFIQKLDKYQDIIYALKFAIIGGDAIQFYNIFKTKRIDNQYLNEFINKLSYTDKRDGIKKILNLGFGRMRYYRNHINIFQDNFEKIEDPFMGDILQVFASFSHKPIIKDTEIIGKHIDYKIAKDSIINKLEFDEYINIKDNTPTIHNDEANKFLIEIGITDINKREWYDVAMIANNMPLGFLTVDWVGRDHIPSNRSELLFYLYELTNFAAQSIQRCTDLKELAITREITSLINEEYDNHKKLYERFSKVLCEKLYALKCEIYSFNNERVINREYLFYNNLRNPSDNSRLYELLNSDKKVRPHEHRLDQNMIGNVLGIIISKLKSESSQAPEEMPRQIYYECVNILNYDDYDKYFIGSPERQVNKENKFMEETMVQAFAINNEKPDLKNCLIAPLKYHDTIIGAIKITNNANRGKIYFPIHEQRILYYVAKQLAIKLNNIYLNDRARRIGSIFEQFSELLIDSESYSIDIFKHWREDLLELDENIKKKIIFNDKLSALTGSDLVVYLGYDPIKNEFVKKGKQSQDFAFRREVWASYYPEIQNIEKYVNEIIINDRQNLNGINEKRKDFPNIVFDGRNKSIMYFIILINNEPFSILFLKKFEGTFNEEIFNIVKTISKQITGVLQIAALRRKGHEVMQNLSHQVIAPLTGLDMYIDQLKRNNLAKSDSKYYEFKNNEKKQYVLSLLQSQTTHVCNIASGYKHFLEIEMQKTRTIERSTFPLVAEVIRIASIYQPIAEMQALIGPKVIADKEYNIYSSRELLFHIVSCLIDNAIKYADKGSKIIIQIMQIEDDKYLLQFIDHGLIIDEHDKGRIFHRTFRSKSAEKRNPHGSGIGLYIVSNFSELLGGQCYLEKSNIKEGTIFSVELAKTLITKEV